MALGTVSLLGWSAAQFMEMSGPFLILSKVHILSEAIMIFNERRAWNTTLKNWSAMASGVSLTEDGEPDSYPFAFGVHSFGLGYAVASMSAVADAYAVPEEEWDMEDYGEEYYGEDVADDDYYGGDYYYGGYY